MSYTYTYKHMHTHSHAHTNTCTHTHMHAHTDMHTHTHMHTLTCTHRIHPLDEHNSCKNLIFLATSVNTSCSYHLVTYKLLHADNRISGPTKLSTRSSKASMLALAALLSDVPWLTGILTHKFHFEGRKSVRDIVREELL